MAALLRPYNALWLPGSVKASGLPRIDWTHPLAAGLVFYAFDNGYQVVDLVSGTVLTTRGNPTYGSGGNGGLGIKYDQTPGTSSYVPASAVPEVQIGNPFSFATSCTLTNSGYIFLRGLHGQNENWSIFLHGSQGAANILNNSGGLISLGAYSITDGVYSSFCTTLDVSGNATFYAQGAQSGGTATGLTAGNLNQANYMFLGDYVIASGFDPVEGYVYYGGFWNRDLTSFEALQLHLDPYCFLLPAEGEMPALLAPVPLIVGWLRDQDDRAFRSARYVEQAGAFVPSAS